MFGIEIVFLIAAIVTAYPCTTEFFRDWKRKHHERRTLREHRKLKLVLEGSPKEVQSIRDELCIELAEACYRGDESACKALRERLAAADETIKLLLTAGNDPTVRRYQDPIYQLLSDVQRKALSGMKHHSQRVVRCSPTGSSCSLSRQLTASHCSQRSSRSSNATTKRYNCSAVPVKQEDSNGMTYRRCKDCGWTTDHPRSRRDLCDGGLYPRTRDNCCLDWGCLWQKFHYVSSKSANSCRYRCFVCQDRATMSVGALIEHIYANHRWSEICDGDCTNTSGKCGKRWRREEGGCRAHGVSLSYLS